MIEFGKTLRTARESKGLTTGQIAERTHMMVQMVEGLENENFSKIVAPIYGRGFVKLYCEAVGLEPKPLVEAFMELYTGRHMTSGEQPPALEPVKTDSSRPARPSAAEPPPRMQGVMDFDAPIPASEQTRSSRYAAAMPDDDGFSMPLLNWRMIALAATAVAIVVLTILGVRALYRVTMTSPERTAEVAAPSPATTTSPANAAVDRKPLPLKPFYIDSNHKTETEK